MAVAKGPPTKPASDSAVMAKSSTKESQSPQAIPGHFPTLAESYGEVRSTKEVSSARYAEGSIELFEFEGCLCISLQYSHTRKGRGPEVGDIPKEHYNSNDHRDGPGNSSLFLEECDKDS